MNKFCDCKSHRHYRQQPYQQPISLAALSYRVTALTYMNSPSYIAAFILHAPITVSLVQIRLKVKSNSSLLNFVRLLFFF